MNFYTFRSVRKHRKWIFKGSEVFGGIGNGFFFFPSGSERLKMDFYTFRATQNEFLFILSRSEASKMNFYTF